VGVRLAPQAVVDVDHLQRAQRQPVQGGDERDAVGAPADRGDHELAGPEQIVPARVLGRARQERLVVSVVWAIHADLLCQGRGRLYCLATARSGGNVGPCRPGRRRLGRQPVRDGDELSLLCRLGAVDRVGRRAGDFAGRPRLCLEPAVGPPGPQPEGQRISCHPGGKYPLTPRGR
ncbi:hypothetical protein LCGC14_0933520, partial [marine sediment metagenome]